MVRPHATYAASGTRAAAEAVKDRVEAVLTPPAVRQPRRWRTAGIGLAVLVVLGLAAWLVAPSNKLMVVLTYAVVLAIAGQGLNFLYGRGGQLSVAQGAVWGVGAYAAAIAFDRFGVGFWIAVPLSVVAGCVAAIVVALPARRVSGHYFVITTFAAAEIFTIVCDNATSLTGGNGGLFVGASPGSFGPLAFDDPADYFLLAWAFYLIVLGAAFLLHTSDYGRRLFAASKNETLARALGVNVARDRFVAFVVGGAACGLAGVLYLYSTRYIEPSQFNSNAGIALILIVMVGGAGYLLGPLAGAMIVALIPEVAAFGPAGDQLFYGCVLILVIMLAPNGVAGYASRLASARWPGADKLRRVR